MAKVRDIVADILIDAGIEYVYGLPGGANMFMFDPLFDRQDRIKTILARHEQGAACMADMYGRLTGKPGVVICQGGWAGSNAALGIMEAYAAGSPMLVLADFSDYGGLVQHMPYQCMSGEYGAIDLRNIFKGMTKYTSVAHRPSEFIHGVQLAIKHATTGKPGPAAVIARWDVITGEIEEAAITPKLYPVTGRLGVSPPCLSASDAEKIADYLVEAKNPIMVCGRGIHACRAYDEVQEIAELIGMPVATSFMGKSSIAETHDLALGTTGNLGQKIANEKLISADLIFAVATGLAPENNKMLNPEWIKPEKQKIIQIDIEPLNVAFTYPVTMGATSDAKLALRMIIDAVKARSAKIDVKKRIEAILKMKKELNYFSDKQFVSDETPIAPERVVKDLNDSVGPEDLIVLDGGNNRAWMTKFFQSKKAGQVIGPGGVTGIGWSVPASLAAQIHLKDRNVIAVCGDGGMMMELYCLESAKQYDLPITYVVYNNSCLGNVMDYQPADRRLATEYEEPKLADIARGVGIQSYRIEKAEDFKPAMHEALSSRKPALLDVISSQQPHFKVMTT